MSNPGIFGDHRKSFESQPQLPPWELRSGRSWLPLLNTKNTPKHYLNESTLRFSDKTPPSTSMFRIHIPPRKTQWNIQICRSYRIHLVNNCQQHDLRHGGKLLHLGILATLALILQISRIWDPPIFGPLIDLGFDLKVLSYSYRADTPIPTTFVAIPEQKKILVACLFKPLCPPQSQPAKWWFLNRYWKIRSVAKISVLIIFNLQGVYCPQFFLFNGNHLSKKVIKR